MSSTNIDLTAVAAECNAQLETAGHLARWAYDADESSNSVGTWYCYNIGGVTDADQMRQYTAQIIESHAKHNAQ